MRNLHNEIKLIRKISDLYFLKYLSHSQTPEVPYQSAVFEKAAKSGHGFQFPNCVSFGLSLF